MIDHPEPSSTQALVLERVELAFPELLPGFRIEERHVRFNGAVVADLLARAGSRTLLISLVEADESAAALRALDSLSFARTQRELLADYLPGEAFTGTPPEVVLVAESFSPQLKHRLAAFTQAADFWLVARHELTTARGSLTRLTPVHEPKAAEPPSVELPNWATEEPLRGFLAQVAPDRLGLALESIERIARIDPGLEWEACDTLAVSCHLEGTSLCRLAWIDGHLELHLEEGGIPHAIRDSGAIDFVLDWVLTNFLELVEAKRGGAGPQRGAQGEARPRIGDFDPGPSAAPDLHVASYSIPRAPGACEAESAELEDLDPSTEALEELPESELRQVELIPEPPPPLLSDEELQAFHE